MAPWNTTAASVQRTAQPPRPHGEHVLALQQHAAGGGGPRRQQVAAAMVDLPQPDSPARPRVSPGSRVRSTPRTAGTAPARPGS